MKKGGRYSFAILLAVLLASVVLLDFVHEQATGRDVLDVVEADDVARRDVDLSQRVEVRSERQGNRQLQPPQQNKNIILQTKEDSNNINNPFMHIQPSQNADALGQLQQFLEDLKATAVIDVPTTSRGYTFSENGQGYNLQKIRENFINGNKNIIIWLRDTNIQDFLSSAPQFKEYIRGSTFVAGFIDDIASIDGIASNPSVVLIAPDEKITHSLIESRPLVSADKVENDLKVTGKGVTVCVIDSGIDYTHPSLGGCTTQQFLAGQCSKVVGGYDFCPYWDGRYCVGTDPDPMDIAGHGTHVAGIVASSHNRYRGVAPGANLVAANALGSGTFGTLSSLAAAIDWCVTNAQKYNIKIITMSLIMDTIGYNELRCPNYINPAIKRATDAGIFVDAASGNYARLHGVEYPACAPGVTSVGAVYDADVGKQIGPGCTDQTTQADKISCFASRGSNLDLLAPGSMITSTASSKGNICGAPNGGFADCDGTSMAAPHVAGAAALLYEQHPNLKPAQVESILRNFGVPIVDPMTNYIIPRIDSYTAVKSVNLPFISIMGQPYLGNRVVFSISDRTKGGKLYLLLFSTSDSPGITLPDNRIIPLTPNGVFFLSFQSHLIGFQKAQGNFDDSGYAESSWDIPALIPPGLKLYFSFITLDLSLPFPQNIVSISPAKPLTILTNPVVVKNAILPTPSHSHSCASSQTTGKIYCFGALTNRIIEYDSSADRITVKNAVLPLDRVNSLSCTAETMTGKIYCFGGEAGLATNGIIEYDPSADRITVKNAVLPLGLSRLSCATSAATNKIYCFGGGASDRILEYDLVADKITVTNAIFPDPAYSLSCATSSAINKIYCFGGVFLLTTVDKIVEYTPS